MPKVKLTKNELKKQRDALKRFNRYLPTLKLKQQQLQMVLRDIEKSMQAVQEKLQAFRNDLHLWVELFADSYTVSDFIHLKEIRSSIINIAGTDIPKFEAPVFEVAEYSLYSTPPWVDSAVEALKKDISMSIELDIIREQHRRISHELNITIQRVNLFEKVRIPEAKNTIRTIQIYLGDQQTAAIVRGKLAKGAAA